MMSKASTHSLQMQAKLAQSSTWVSCALVTGLSLLGPPRGAGYMDSSLWPLRLCHLEGFHPQRLSFQVNVCLQKLADPQLAEWCVIPKPVEGRKVGLSVVLSLA